MPRTITVKGIGNVKTAPDYIVISMSLEAQNIDYNQTIELAAKKIDNLKSALEEVSIDKKSLKTTDFNVRTDYKGEQDKDGNYKSVFNGYVCTHQLKIEFDFNTKRLAEILYAISKCTASPELSIAFTVKDASAVSKELLRSATVAAREKAEILCEASGVELGSLISIDYNRKDINPISRTSYMLDNKCLAKSMSRASDIEIEPESINVSDTATFVWEIK